MHNSEVESALVSCESDLASVKAIIDGLGITSNIVPYLTKYAVIRGCGTIEQAFKTVVADRCAYRCKSQVKRYIEIKVRLNSSNPSYSNICGLLKDFDEDWNSRFKLGVKGEPNSKQITDSLQSLVDARNDFAHGGDPSASISDVLTYFENSKRVIEILDDVVHA